MMIRCICHFACWSYDLKGGFSFSLWGESHIFKSAILEEVGVSLYLWKPQWYGYSTGNGCSVPPSRYSCDFWRSMTAI